MDELGWWWGFKVSESLIGLFLDWMQFDLAALLLIKAGGVLKEFQVLVFLH